MRDDLDSHDVFCVIVDSFNHNAKCADSEKSQNFIESGELGFSISCVYLNLMEIVDV
jgi:hypothetical protein